MPTTKTRASQVLAFFATLAGIGEHPPGSNCNFISHWFGYCAAWCAMTVSYVLNKFGCLWMIHGKQDYTVDLYENAVADKTWRAHNFGKPLPGWLVLFNFGDWNYGGRPLGIHHVGMLKQTTTDPNRFAVWEGNTDDDVRLRLRSRDNIAGFIALPWAESRDFFVRVGLVLSELDLEKIVEDLNALRKQKGQTPIPPGKVTKRRTKKGKWFMDIGPYGGTNPTTIANGVRVLKNVGKPGGWGPGKVRVIPV